MIYTRCARDFTRVTVCGMVSPPYRTWSEDENAAMLSAINAASPDVLWVGMTAPKQEKWVETNRAHLKEPVIGSVGAVFDFYAGTYPRAPAWMCRFGIEWLYRLVKEPQRMWRRNFISSPLFVLLVLRRHLLRMRACGDSTFHVCGNASRSVAAVAFGASAARRYGGVHRHHVLGWIFLFGLPMERAG